MKKLLITAVFFIAGCSEKPIDEKILVLECFNYDAAKNWDQPVFIWYKANNSLDGSDGSSTPYQSHNDFRTTFVRDFTDDIAVDPRTERREIIYDEFKKDLSIRKTWRYSNGDPYYLEPNNYSCKVIEDNR